MTREGETPSNRPPAPEPSATEALAAIRAARAGLPGPPAPHAGFDLLYGTACALLVAAQGLAAPWSMLLLGLALAGLALMVHVWRRRFGWWINGYSPRRARWVAYGMVAVFLALIAASAYGREHGPWWLFLAAGGAGFVAAILGSRLWMRVWRAELAGGVR
jgi:phosphatidylglycerophosphate synthase